MSGFEPGGHLIVAYGAGLFAEKFAFGEDHEVGDAAHVVAGGELGIGVGFYFEYEGLAGGFGGGAGDFGRSGAAGTAPGGPEVNENGDAGFANDFVEESGVGVDGFVDWRERLFAGTAAARVSEVCGGNAIFCAAVRASSDNGQASLLGFTAVGVWMLVLSSAGVR